MHSETRKVKEQKIPGDIQYLCIGWGEIQYAIFEPTKLVLGEISEIQFPEKGKQGESGIQAGDVSQGRIRDKRILHQ